MSDPATRGGSYPANAQAVPPAIESLYQAHEPLRIVETGYDHRVPERRKILRFIERGSIGAEIGVFTGLFSEFILRHRQLHRLHLVDACWHSWGEFYPDWGAYTAHGKLSTRVAQEAAATRTDLVRRRCDVRFHVRRSTEWLAEQPDHSLDWVYLDASHSYDETVEELMLLRRKVRRGGHIIGDDWHPHPEARHHGVFRAVHHILRSDPHIDLVYAGIDLQYALRVG